MTEYPTAWQRSQPNFCAYYARRTPMIPYHNGQLTYRIRRHNGTIDIIRKPCLGCRRTAQ